MRLRLHITPIREVSGIREMQQKILNLQVTMWERVSHISYIKYYEGLKDLAKLLNK